jgi:hypothetical protein
MTNSIANYRQILFPHWAGNLGQEILIDFGVHPAQLTSAQGCRMNNSPRLETFSKLNQYALDSLFN